MLNDDNEEYIDTGYNGDTLSLYIAVLYTMAAPQL